ncbi:MAG: hypothetical protein GXP60_00255 [Epsilonproteobacteria bacterium]|nr:hypothetical protein [Campylobacterota bacterium]
MIWAKAVLLFIVGTAASSVVANLSSFSTQICSVSFALLVIIKGYKSYADLLLFSFLIGVMEDILEGATLGTNFLLFVVPVVAAGLAVKFIKQNILFDFLIFIFLSVSIPAIKSVSLNFFSIAEPSIMSFSGWMIHNTLPVIILYVILYLFYKWVLEKSDRVI